MKPLFILLLLAFAAFGQQITVAVLPSDGNTFSNDELEALTDKMREAALKVLPTDAFILLKQDVVVKRLGGAENYIKECKESSCIVNLGKKAQVDYVAQASVGKLGGKMRVKVELYNVSTEGLIGIFNEYFDNFFSLLNAIDKRVPDLFKKISDVSVRKSFTDVRDGREYKMVVIGKQTWMAENLNYNASGSKCYDNKPANCDKYGRLYNWETAMKACPKGWHLPSNAEWDILLRFVDGTSGTESPYSSKTAGKLLKAKIGWNDDNEGKSGNGTDVYGFSALPGGGSTSDDIFDCVGDYGVWWSTFKYNANDAYRRIIYRDSDYAYGENNNKSFLHSVRCLQD